MDKQQASELLEQVQKDYAALLQQEQQLLIKKHRLEGAAEALTLMLKEEAKEEVATEE